MLKKIKKKLKFALHAEKKHRLLRKEVDFLAPTIDKHDDLSHIPRGRLLHLAKNSKSATATLLIFNTLRSQDNFKSAYSAVSHLDPNSLKDNEFFKIALVMLSSDQGVYADKLIEARLHTKSCLIEKNSIIPALSTIAHSGWTLDKKLGAIEQIKECLDLDSNDPSVLLPYRQEIDIATFKLLFDSSRNIDILNYAKLDQLDLDNPNYQLRFVKYLQMLGYRTELSHLMDKVNANANSSDLTILLANLSVDEHWLQNNGISCADLPAGHFDNFSLLKFAYANKPKSPFFDAIYQKCIKAQLATFHTLKISNKKILIQHLITSDQIHTADELIQSANLPDTLLPTWIVRGLQYFQIDDYHSAKACFELVSRENPSDSMATQGMRLILSRIGSDGKAYIRFRNTIGFGLKSAGRSGCKLNHGSAPDITTELQMCGNYIDGLYAKRHAPHWKYLKSIYPQGFFNYERLPEHTENHSIFVIGDEGVGDEIRTAQHYGALTQRFSKVTISCDPRLISIFQRSYPTIEFTPVTRYRSGVRDMPNNITGRMMSRSPKLSHLLSDECQPLMNRADLITFGQNLLFNRFIGEIKRPSEGPYLSTAEDNDHAHKHRGTHKLKVGLLWRSHFETTWRKFMYLRIQDLKPILGNENIEFWSMQHEIKADERDFCEKNGIKLIEGIDLYNDFDGFASVLKGFDLAIGLSSAPLELAAAAGTPVWMLGFSPENYYLRTRGGQTSEDQLTLNSTIIAPPEIDFSAPRDECISLVLNEVQRHLTILIDKQAK